MTYETIKDIQNSTKNFETETMNHFFHVTSQQLMTYLEIATNRDATFYENATLETLQEENYKLFEHLLPLHYGHSYANPVYTSELFGDRLGQITAYLASQIQVGIQYAFHKQTDELDRLCQLYSVIYNTLIKEGKSSEEVVCAIRDHVLSTQQAFYMRHLKNTYSHENRKFNDIILNSDLNDPKYLYKFGVFITENELKLQRFLATYDEVALSNVADSIVRAYINGFVRDNKDISLRHGVRIVSNAGQERLTRMIIERLSANNLMGFVTTIVSTEFNQQVAFDHKFDKGLYLDEATNEDFIKHLRSAAEENAQLMKDYSGILYIEKFGEAPFSPQNHSSRIKLDEQQQKWQQKFEIEQSQTIEKYIPETERSFCIVAFPSPEIGEQFESIFSDTVLINQMDSSVHEKIQQVIIDALDLGTFVHVKGYKGNKTDIKVKMQKLKDPSKHTNFVNCVADVNIPVGEVFTSPSLKETNGVLHVDTVYLDNFNYKNLTLNFEEGYIQNYNCSNFEEDQKNKEYVRENLLFPHQTLPIGEFAIGTNTFAYVIGEKYNIVDKMPILIVEKMGPHFAIGDTCFSWAEDNSVYNPTDGKEITARDNERSALRKEDVSKAYTNCHTDITIPYDSIEHITVITEQGTLIPIIEHGRFVLPGTEALNIPFDNKESY